MNGQSVPENQNVQTAPPAGQTPAQPTLIGFSSPDINDRFQRYLESSVRLYADMNHIDYVIADAENDLQTQYRQIRRMIEQDKVQGLIVIPVDTSAMEPVTVMAKRANIPLVYLNRQPFPLDRIPQGVYYVGSDPVDAGVKQADFLAEHLQAGNLAILMGIPNLENTIRRTAGLENRLKSIAPDIQVIAKDYANFLRQPAYEITKRWIAQFGNRLNAIAANNDEMALGAVQALQEAGRPDVTVVGIDALLPGREAVQQGLLAATVFQDATTQGETAIDMIRQLTQGQTPAQQYVLVPHLLITAGAQPQAQAPSGS